MKRLIIFAVFIVIAVPVESHNGMIAFYTDATATSCSTVLPPPYLTANVDLLYIRDVGPKMGRAFEFVLYTSQNQLVVNSVYWSPAFTVIMCDDPFTLCMGAGPGCLSRYDEPIIWLGTFTFMWLEFTTPPEFYIEVRENPDALPEPGIIITMCNSENTAHLVIGHKFVFNGPCDPIPPDLSPKLAEASASSNFNVLVTFSEEVSAATAEEPANYEIYESGYEHNTKTVVDAILLEDPREVLLTLGESLNNGEEYTLRVSNVEDLDGMTIRPGSEITFVKHIIHPELIDAIAHNSTEIIVTYSEAVTNLSAEEVANYEIYETNNDENTITILDAALLDDHQSVLLTVEDYFDDCIEYTLRVSNVEDVDGITILPGSETPVLILKDLEAIITSVPSGLVTGCESFSLEFTITNVGAMPVDSFRTSVRLSEDELIDRSDLELTDIFSASLDAGESVTKTIEVTIPDDAIIGDIYIGIITDDREWICETNEDNNVSISPFSHNVPQISTIYDVFKDQGGKVRVNFAASPRDVSGSPTPVIQYEAFRRIDNYSAVNRIVTGEGEGSSIRNNAGPANSEYKMLSNRNMLIDGWEFVGAIPAHVEAVYNMIVPTLEDSTADSGIYWSVYFIRAATAQPDIFFDSCPDSGYSVDNLAPNVPQGLAAQQVENGLAITWHSNREADFRYYALYRDGAIDFEPALENLICTTTDTFTVDDSWSSMANFFYKLTAVDFCGNESGCALITPKSFNEILLNGYSTSVEQTLIKISWALTEHYDGATFFVLRGKIPGGKYEELSQFEIIQQELSFIYEDSDIEPGSTYRYRIDISNEFGRFALFETEPVSTPSMPLTLYQNYPNPFNPLTTIRYYLPEKSNVTLEIYDVSGRRIICLVEQPRAKGYYTIDWGGVDMNGNRVASGIYISRLTTGKNSISRKMVLIK